MVLSTAPTNSIDEFAAAAASQALRARPSPTTTKRTPALTAAATATSGRLYGTKRPASKKNSSRGVESHWVKNSVSTGGAITVLSRPHQRRMRCATSVLLAAIAYSRCAAARSLRRWLRANALRTARPTIPPISSTRVAGSQIQRAGVWV